MKLLDQIALEEHSDGRFARFVVGQVEIDERKTKSYKNVHFMRWFTQFICFFFNLPEITSYRIYIQAQKHINASRYCTAI